MSTTSRLTKPTHGIIRVGIGGWSYAPWHETFYPAKLPRSKALEYASRHLSAIEVNSTFYGSQKPATFDKWREVTPDGFVFALKGPRGATHRSDLGDAKASIDRFIDSGIDRLGNKLGPLLWQFPETRTFDIAAFEKFFNDLPTSIGTLRLRHAVDVRHASFGSKAFVHLARKHRIAISFTDAKDMPAISDATGDFFYARLRHAQSRLKTGYTLSSLKNWAKAAESWSAGAIPSDFPPIGDIVSTAPRDAYVFFINGAKERAPAAALRLITLLG